jgi:hypothetical protein
MCFLSAYACHPRAPAAPLFRPSLEFWYGQLGDRRIAAAHSYRLHVLRLQYQKS